MSANVVKLGFVGLNVADAAAMRHHFGEVVGLPVLEESSADEIFLACGSERHVLGLYAGKGKGLRHFGFRLDAGTTLDGAEKSLRAAGVKATRQSDSFPGIKSSLEIHDPDGNTIHLYADTEPPAAPYKGQGVAPIKLGHIALYVSDWSRLAPFYKDVLGFRISDWTENVFVFMRCNSEHHTINLTNSPSRGMFHLALEVRDLNHIGLACDHLALHGVHTVWGPGRHGIGHSLFAYHRDPDGNIIEFMAEMDRMSNEGIGYFDPRPFHEDMPQRPKAWGFDPASSNIWGVMPPPGFLGE